MQMQENATEVTINNEDALTNDQSGLFN